jgi:hypothetical protein
MPYASTGNHELKEQHRLRRDKDLAPRLYATLFQFCGVAPPPEESLILHEQRKAEFARTSIRPENIKVRASDLGEEQP